MSAALNNGGILCSRYTLLPKRSRSKGFRMTLFSQDNMRGSSTDFSSKYAKTARTSLGHVESAMLWLPLAG